MANLRRVAQPDGSGLRPTDFEHALSIAVSPEALDLESLTQNPYGPYARVKWHPSAIDEQMSLVAGRHRRDLALELTQERIEERKRLTDLAAKQQEQGRHEDHARTLTAIDAITSAMEHPSVWLVMFYDQGRNYPQSSRHPSHTHPASQAFRERRSVCYRPPPPDHQQSSTPRPRQRSLPFVPPISPYARID